MSETKLYLIAHHKTEPRWKYHDMMDLYPDPRVADYHKIGVAEKPEKRLASLNTGTPHELELVTTVESDHAKAVESMLHRIHLYTKQTGEWFYLSTNTVNSIKALERLDKAELEPLCDYMPTWLVETSLYVEVMRQRDVGGGEYEQ